MTRYHHHHRRDPHPFEDARTLAHHDPFAGPWFDPREGRRGPFVGGPAPCGPVPEEQRRRFRDQPAGPGPRGGHGRFAGGPPFGPGFGPEGPFGPRGPEAAFEAMRGRGFRHGRRAGRGDIRSAILLLLAEQPRHGYDLIREIAERTDGAWTASPGAVYPALSLLEDEGLVTIAAEGGRRLASLSEAGLAYVTAHADELGDPFADANARTPKSRWALRDAVRGLMGASMQVAQTGDEAQVARALVVLDRARKDLYLVLAGEAPGAAPAPADDEPGA
jgi:DNA-binding PadR family transcriptional regulator